ncbi:MAG: hypothetical protein KAI24_01635 [Planctomycetes bacterium]|nr:hypothetical protein [Planctomycetota bacterium]
MMRSTLSLLAASALLLTNATAQVIPTGSVVVLRVGDPSGLPLSSDAHPVFLDVYDSQTNALLSTIAIPNSTSTPPATPSFCQTGFSFTEGCLTLSADNRYLVLAGYDRQIGLSDPGNEAAATTPRVVCTVDTLTGFVDASTQLTDAFDAATFRAAISEDGSQFWVSGNGGGGGSVRYATAGATTSIDIVQGPSNGRWLGIHKGQLYMSAASTSASAQGVLQVGDGLPTSLVGAATVLNGFPLTQSIADGAPHDFWFADDQTLYVADDSGFAGGQFCGVQKWTESGGLWTRQYVITTGPGNCAVGLSGIVRNGVPEIWFTDAAGTANSLYKVVDTGPNSVPTLVANEPANSDYRGVVVVGSTIVTTGGACSSARLDVTASGLLGTDIQVRISNHGGFPFINVSFTPLGLPLANCGCTALYDIGYLGGQTDLTLPIPSNPALSGQVVNFQGIDLFDPNTTCSPVVPGLTLSTTDGKSVLLF